MSLWRACVDWSVSTIHDDNSLGKQVDMGGLLNSGGWQEAENVGKAGKVHRAKLCGKSSFLALLSWNKLFTVVVTSEELLLLLCASLTVSLVLYDNSPYISSSPSDCYLVSHLLNHIKSFMLKPDMTEVLFPFLYKREGEKIPACNKTRPVYWSCPQANHFIQTGISNISQSQFLGWWGFTKPLKKKHLPSSISTSVQLDFTHWENWRSFSVFPATEIQKALNRLQDTESYTAL